MSLAIPQLDVSTAPSSRGTLADRAHARLRDLLIAGQVAPGDRLSTRELASRFAMSPMPIRAAIERLVADGALEVRPQSGARVPLMTRARFVELRTIRVALEGMAAEHAAGRVTPRELAAIRAHHERFCKAARRPRPDAAVAIRANQRLHFAVYAAARMPALLAIIEGLWVQIGPVLNLDLRSGPHRLRALAAHEHHAHLVEALERRDGPGARRALVGDIESAAAYILSLGRLPESEEKRWT
jgi:DNA-binding GntR family transcriptional regulator